MTKIFSKTFWISSISSLVVGTGIVLACAGGDWDEYGNSNFTPEIFADAKYKPFFYSYNYYYNINYDEAHNQRFNKQVLQDWNTYLEKKCSEEELNYLLFQTTKLSIDSISRALKKDESYFPAKARTISFLKDRKNKKLSDLISYLSIAKNCEKFALKKDDEVWYYDRKPDKRSCPEDLKNFISAQYKSAKDPFLKERYFFQLVRALYFSYNYSDCATLFESEKNNFTKNYMYFRCMAYAAGAYSRNGDFVRGNYYFSLVYNSYDALKTVAHWSFHPQEEKDWQATLAFCKSNEEKITLWQMLGVYYNDEIRSMYEIYKLDPNHEKLDLLLTRAVNKYENEKFDFGFRDNTSGEIPKANKLKVFIQDLLNGKNISKPYMWRMALGYLETIDKQYSFASEHLKEAEKTLPKDHPAKAQLRSLKLINEVSSLEKLDTKTENKLLPEIKWLRALQSDTALKNFRSSQTYSWLLLAMAKKYREQKDPLKAEFFQTTSDYYVNEEQLQSMKTFLKKKEKSPYEKLCEELYTLKYEDLVEFEAVYKTYNDQSDEALALMTEAGKNGEKTLLSNPFNGNIKDCHDCDHAQPQKIRYTKIMTLKKIKEMKDKLNSDPFNNALLLGNVFYSITFYGSSRLFYECNVMGYSSSEREYINNAFRDKLTDMTLAKKYYTMALNTAKDPEQKAKCLYMLAKCERNEWYNKGNGNEPGKDFMAWKNFVSLKNYSKTNYYKEIIKECGYFRTYSGQ
jgi:hypothetical protein